jgi:hypothetical protein
MRTQEKEFYLLASALDGGECAAFRLGRFTPDARNEAE